MKDELLTKICKEQGKKKNWKRIADYFDVMRSLLMP